MLDDLAKNVQKVPRGGIIVTLESVALPAEFRVKLHERYEWTVCYKFHGNQDEEK